MSIFTYEGNEIYMGKDAHVKSVAHRGYSDLAPENTIPAYVLAWKKGFKYVECDVRYTSDGHPVLLHDATINRTSNGTGSISQLTLSQVRSYDFGSWKNPNLYSETLIPTLQEFADTCRKLSLYPYVELKGEMTEAQTQNVVDVMNAYGFRNKMTYIGESEQLTYVKSYDVKARLGLVAGWSESEDFNTVLNVCLGLQTDYNDVFIDIYYPRATQSVVDLFSDARIPMEAWIAESASDVINANPYITGFTTNGLIVADDVLSEDY